MPASYLICQDMPNSSARRGSHRLRRITRLACLRVCLVSIAKAFGKVHILSTTDNVRVKDLSQITNSHTVGCSDGQGRSCLVRNVIVSHHACHIRRDQTLFITKHMPLRFYKSFALHQHCIYSQYACILSSWLPVATGRLHGYTCTCYSSQPRRYVRGVYSEPGEQRSATTKFQRNISAAHARTRGCTYWSNHTLP